MASEGDASGGSSVDRRLLQPASTKGDGAGKGAAAEGFADSGATPGGWRLRRPRAAVHQLAEAARRRCAKRTPRELLLKYLPFIGLLTSYKPREYLARDLVAGASVCVLHFGQGLGFSVLAGMPPVYGIYVSIVHPLVYFFLGTSRHMSIGTMSLTSILVGAAVAREADTIDSVASAAAAAAAAATTTPHSIAAAVASSASAAAVSVATSTAAATSASVATLNASIVAVNGTDLDLAAAAAVAADAAVALRVEVALLLAFLVGIFQLTLGLLRFGIVTSYLSPPFVGGFTCAAALHIASSQARFAFFGKVAPLRGGGRGALKLFRLWYEVFAAAGSASWLCTVCFVVSFSILLAVKQGINKNPRLRHRLFVPVPVDLAVVVLATVLSHFLNFANVPDPQRGVLVIGPLPIGFPTPAAPRFDRAVDLIADALAIAVVGYLFNYSIATFFRDKYKYPVDVNQELLASGVSHVAGAFFGCFAGAASPPRSFVQDAAGGRTQLASVVSCALLIIVLYLIGPHVSQLPFAVVAALVVVSVKRLVLQLRDVPRLWRADRIDCVIWVVAFVATTALDVDYGMMVGIAFNLFAIAFRFQIVAAQVCRDSIKTGNEPTPPSRWPESWPTSDARRSEVAAIIVSYDAPLLFPNAERFRRSVMKSVETARKARASEVPKDSENPLSGVTSINTRHVAEVTATMPNDSEGKHEDTIVTIATNVSPSPAAQRVVLDCSHVVCADTTGAAALVKLRNALSSIGCQLVLAGCSPSLSAKFTRCLLNPADLPRQFSTVWEAAVGDLNSESEKPPLPLDVDHIAEPED